MRDRVDARHLDDLRDHILARDRRMSYRKPVEVQKALDNSFLETRIAIIVIRTVRVRAH